MDLSRAIPLPKRKLAINFVSISFWIIFGLNYLYLNRVLIVATNDRFRLGAIVLVLSSFVILVYLKVVKEIVLALVIFLFAGVSLLSALSNDIPLLQFVAFIRIPFVVYLIYNLVRFYLDSKERVEKVMRILYFIAALQLPVIVIQRFLYPYLPETIIFGSSLTDFGMGTFPGDTAMAFALIGLVALLLFERNIKGIIKHRWLLAGWLSLTILFSNSQVQHVTIIIVWGVYFVSHFKLKNIGFGIISVVSIIVLIVILSQSALMTYPFIQSTFKKVSDITQIFDANVDYEKFLDGKHARSAAISYYLNQPFRWIGQGPGSAYDTSTGARSIGGWGHIYTFYAEVGIIGLILSYLIFFVIAFPINVGRSTITIRAGWFPVLMFLGITLVTLVKYPLGDTAILFTYCLLIIGQRVLSKQNFAAIPSDIF